MTDFKIIKAKRATLVEIDEETYEHMRDVVPPKYAEGCFAMGEPVSHEPTGVTYYWAGKRGERYFATYGTRHEAESAFAYFGMVSL